MPLELSVDLPHVGRMFYRLLAACIFAALITGWFFTWSAFVTWLGDGVDYLVPIMFVFFVGCLVFGLRGTGTRR